MRTRCGLMVLALCASMGAIAPDVAEAAGCAVVRGSLEKGAGVVDQVDPGPPMFDVRAGRHECFDRMVVDVRGRTADYHAEYVSGVTELATGDPIPLRGGAFLAIVASADVRDDSGAVTFPRIGRAELVAVTGWQTFRQIAWAGSQEGVTQIGIGVRARLPFRVFILAGPGTGSRLVVDVAHRW